MLHCGVDSALDLHFFRLLKKDSAAALSQQFLGRLMLGTSWLSLHHRLKYRFRLLGDEARQLTGFLKFAHDVCAANKLLVDVELRDGRPR